MAALAGIKSKILLSAGRVRQVAVGCRYFNMAKWLVHHKSGRPKQVAVHPRDRRWQVLLYIIAVSVWVGALVYRQINKYSSKGPISCSSSCLPFVGVRMVSCHSAVQLCLLLSNAINRLVCQFFFFFF